MVKTTYIYLFAILDFFVLKKQTKNLQNVDCDPL